MSPDLFRPGCVASAPAVCGVHLHAWLGILCYLSLMFTYFMSWYFPGEHTFQ